MELVQNHPVVTAVMVVLIVLIVVVVGGFAFVWRTIGSVVGARVPVHEVTPGAYGLDYSDFTCETADGVTLHGWYIPAGGPRATVLMLNGDRGERDGLLGHARFLHDEGCSVILFDYRHHGESGDDAITYGAREVLDVEAVLDRARENGIIEGKLIIFGLSMGAATAILAGPDLEGVDGFILNSGFAEFGKAMREHIRRMLLPAPVVYPVARLAFKIRSGGVDPDRLKPVERIGDIEAPVLIMHGGRDQQILEYHGEALYDAADDPKTYAYFPEAGHIIVGDELDDIRNEEYKETVITFIDSICENGKGRDE